MLSLESVLDVEYSSRAIDRTTTEPCILNKTRVREQITPACSSLPCGAPGYLLDDGTKADGRFPGGGATRVCAAAGGLWS
jgi:hypothetical protein